jgi:transposase
MNTKEMIADTVSDFLELNPPSRWIRWIMVLFLLFCGIPQKTVASVTNYTDRQIRNIRDKFENSNGDFLREGGKRGRKKRIKKRIFGRIVKYIVDHPRSTLKDVAACLKEEYKLEVSVKTIERELEEYDLSDLFMLVRKKEKRTVYVNYAGGWLLAPFIADTVKKIRQAYEGLPGSVEAILTLFFLSVFGIERPFHLEDLSDPGFAILTGRNGVLSRTTLFRWVKKCRKSFVLRFYDLTRPLGDFVGKKLKISIDEHVVARWTRKVKIPGTKHPTRGKAMKADKLFYVFELTKKRLLSFKPQQGNATLANTALKMVKELISRVKPKSVRLIMDAGGCKGSVIARMRKIEVLSFLVRGVRQRNQVKQWKKVPREEYKEYTDPGDPKKKIIVADTRTKIKGCKEPIRTILILNEKEKKEKGKFYPIYTDDVDTPVFDLLIEYRSRQNHELCYRVLTHDLSLDALPKSYPLNPKAEKVQFRDKHVMLVGWIKALAFNILGDFKESLDKKYHKMTAGTIVRKFLDRPATIKTTADEIVVKFDYFRECNALKPYCDKINQSNLEISWFKDKVLRFEFESEDEFKKRNSFLSAG